MIKDPPENVSVKIKELGSRSSGLKDAEVAVRLKQYGNNELKKTQRNTPLKILLGQFTSNFILYVLIAAGVISYIAHETLNFYVIMAIVCFVIILGFIQEYRAEKAFLALKSMVRQKVRVIRNEQMLEIDTINLVPGDIIALEIGDKVPADSMVWETIDVKIDESMLTGESEPAEKSDGSVIYAGTNVVSGKCKAIVIATGMESRLGQIAGMVQEKLDDTPLQKRIKHLSKVMTVIVFTAAITIMTLGVVQGAPIFAILIVALAVAVSGVPEGLPLTLTLSLVMGMQKLSKNNAIIRHVLAVETLGNVDVICTDKTGTLTKNEMTVEKIFFDMQTISVTGKGYELNGNFLLDDKKIDITKHKTAELLLRGAVLCNNTSLSKNENSVSVVGDPTEGALLVLAEKANMKKESEDSLYKKLEEIIFTSERKIMTTIHNHDEFSVFTKGAPEFVLEKCTHIMDNGIIKKLDSSQRESILEMNKYMSSQALRILGIACNTPQRMDKKDAEKGLIFIGLVGMKDPAREEVKDAIKACQTAGIKVIMITGDNENTAKAIAKEIGLTNCSHMIENEYIKNNEKLRKIVEDHVITGAELQELTDEEFEAVIEDILIYARNMPENKLRIVNTLKKKGHVVAMTGDGINDAPAMRKSDIGIAMGIKGTDVTKETAEVVLEDDNFATIVEAIKGGRAIYENIQKFTYYLISTNFAEVMLITIGIFTFGFELLPLIALQILFLNLVTEEMPAVALGIDPPRKDIMKGRIKNHSQTMLSRQRLLEILPLIMTMALVSIGIFYAYLPFGIETARTMVLLTMITFEVFNAFNFKSLDASILKSNLLGNKWLLLAIAGTYIMTLIVLYVPVFQQIFRTVPLGLTNWIISFGAASSVIFLMEFQKYAVSRSNTS